MFGKSCLRLRSYGCTDLHTIYRGPLVIMVLFASAGARGQHQGSPPVSQGLPCCQ